MNLKGLSQSTKHILLLQIRIKSVGYTFQFKSREKNLWLKVTYFLQILAHNRILTQECIIRKGFERMTMCYLYHGQQESSKLLFNLCLFSKDLWQRLQSLFHQSYHDHCVIFKTIPLWCPNPFSCPILHRSWSLLL